MRRIGETLVVVALLATPAVGNDIYTWRDPSGVSHYSNAPVPGARAVDLYDSAVAPDADAGPAPAAAATEVIAAPAGEAIAPADAASDEERTAFSTGAALRRQALERSYRNARHRLQELDRSLTQLASFRVQHANQGTRAEDVKSDEEKDLAGDKVALEREVEQTRREYAALEAEVSSRLGGTPDWWIALAD